MEKVNSVHKVKRIQSCVSQKIRKVILSIILTVMFTIVMSSKSYSLNLIGIPYNFIGEQVTLLDYSPENDGLFNATFYCSLVTVQFNTGLKFRVYYLDDAYRVSWGVKF